MTPTTKGFSMPNVNTTGTNAMTATAAAKIAMTNTSTM